MTDPQLALCNSLVVPPVYFSRTVRFGDCAVLLLV